MRRNIAQSIQYSGLVVFLLCNGAFFLWMLSLFRQDESTAKRLDTRPESPSSQQWSAGSAFFTVTATCFGFYAQPRGSLLFSKSGRVWRLSPLYALADTITIFWLWIYADRQHNQDRGIFLVTHFYFVKSRRRDLRCLKKGFVSPRWVSRHTGRDVRR